VHARESAMNLDSKTEDLGLNTRRLSTPTEAGSIRFQFY